MSNEYTPPPSVAAQLDAIVASANARAEHSQRLASGDGTQGSVKTGHDGTSQILGEVREAARIPDDGRDLTVERFNDQKRVDDLQAKLDAHTFDSRTGAKIAAAQGRTRELIEMELQSALNAALFAEPRYQKLEAQRENDAAWKAAEHEERAARFAFTAGDPVREAAYEAALLQAEADTAANAALARRYERGQR